MNYPYRGLSTGCAIDPTNTRSNLNNDRSHHHQIDRTQTITIKIDQTSPQTRSSVNIDRKIGHNR